uniref:Uncharacterized protein n=1 Tax=Ascaris lumbricoides TaxID=6252 RepID=A0A9J2PI32_ASCLU
DDSPAIPLIHNKRCDFEFSCHRHKRRSSSSFYLLVIVVQTCPPLCRCVVLAYSIFYLLHALSIHTNNSYPLYVELLKLNSILLVSSSHNYSMTTVIANREDDEERRGIFDRDLDNVADKVIFYHL